MVNCFGLISADDIKVVEGNFYEGELVTLEIFGGRVKRRVYFDSNAHDLYITYYHYRYYYQELMLK